MYAVMEWCIHDSDLTVQGHTRFLAWGFHPNLFGAEYVEISCILDLAKEGCYCEPHQTPPARTVKHVQEQPTDIEAFSHSQIETLQLIFIVSHKDNRRHSH